MPKIMDAGAVPMPPKLLCRTQANGLADGGEVIPSAAIGQAFTTIRYEERFRGDTKKPIPFPGIAGQPDRCAGREREQAGLSEFTPSEGKDARLQIDIGNGERNRLADPEAGDGDEAEQGRTG